MALTKGPLESLIDTSRPHVPCMYDYYLGGKYNAAIDREAARKAVDAAPMIPMIARENRRFLRRSVRYISEKGVKQFLDIGSGLPTVGNTHEVAQSVNTDAKVVYVDHEPVVKILGEKILAKDERTIVIIESALQPERILQHPDVERLIDFLQPVGLLMYSLLHFISDEDLPRILTPFYNALPAGSYVAASHSYTPPTFSEFTYTSANSQKMQQQYNSAATTVYGRSQDEIRKSIFTLPGWKLEEPGLVMVPEWKPDERDPSEAETDQCFMVGAVSKKL